MGLAYGEGKGDTNVTYHGVVVKDEPRNNPTESDHRCAES